MKNKIINKLNYIIIDSLLFKNKNNIKYLIRMLENSKINLNKVNLLILDYKKNYINYDLLTAFFNSLNIAVVEIDNKKSYQHINQIFNFVKIYAMFFRLSVSWVLIHHSFLYITPQLFF